MQVADPLGIRRGVVRTAGAHEERDQTAVPGIEVQVIFLGYVQVGLIDHQRHAQHPLVKLNRRFSVGADEGEMMDALGWNVCHGKASAAPERGAAPAAKSLAYTMGSDAEE